VRRATPARRRGRMYKRIGRSIISAIGRDPTFNGPNFGDHLSSH
jgi:hypothetical protein